MAAQIEKVLHLSGHRSQELSRLLSVSGVRDSPAGFLAHLLAECCIYLLLGVLLAPISPALLFLCAAFALLKYLLSMDKLKEAYRRHTREIEYDLPKFCSVINSRISSTSSALVILQSYLPVASPAMAAEIARTIGDMKTGNPEQALRRMEQRINSPKVSDVLRGLISVQNGDDQAAYFVSKQQQLNNDYQMARKKDISSRPLKLTLPGLIAFLFFFLILLYPIAVSMLQYTSELF